MCFMRDGGKGGRKGKEQKAKNKGQSTKRESGEKLFEKKQTCANFFTNPAYMVMKRPKGTAKEQDPAGATPPRQGFSFEKPLALDGLDG